MEISLFGKEFTLAQNMQQSLEKDALVVKKGVKRLGISPAGQFHEAS